MQKPVLYIVIPCYNEQEVLPITAPMFLKKLTQLCDDGLISDDSRIMFVNDGSSDGTWELIRALSEENEHYIGISQSRNRGHQNALLAGLMEARDRCDISISIDCDGQDDIDAMDKMVAMSSTACARPVIPTAFLSAPRRRAFISCLRRWVPRSCTTTQTTVCCRQGYSESLRISRR